MRLGHSHTCGIGHFVEKITIIKRAIGPTILPLNIDRVYIVMRPSRRSIQSNGEYFTIWQGVIRVGDWLSRNTRIVRSKRNVLPVGAETRVVRLLTRPVFNQFPQPGSVGVDQVELVVCSTRLEAKTIQSPSGDQLHMVSFHAPSVFLSPSTASITYKFFEPDRYVYQIFSVGGNTGLVFQERDLDSGWVLPKDDVVLKHPSSIVSGMLHLSSNVLFFSYIQELPVPLATFRE